MMTLIINADDYGLTKSINIAIHELVKLGTVSSTTVMINQPYANEIKQLIGSCGIGLHFNLTQGKPITTPNKIRSLVDSSDNFYPIKEFKRRLSDGKLIKEQILIEINAQFNALYDLVGNCLDHIDSHQDINKLNMISKTLGVFVSSLDRKYGLRVYNKYYLNGTNEKPLIINPGIKDIPTFGIKRAIVETVFRYRKKKLSNLFSHPDGMLLPRTNRIRDLFNTLTLIDPKGIPDYCLEIGCHPSTSVEGLYETVLLSSRVEEYKLLKSEEFKKAIQKYQLINYSQIHQKL